MSRHTTSTSSGTVGYIGAFPPSPLPTAMFTLDLANATDLIGWQSKVIAVDPRADPERWRDSKIIASIAPSSAASFAAAAEAIAKAEIDLLCLQFAPDLYTPIGLANLSQFCRLVCCPIVATMHALEDADVPPSAHLFHAIVPRVDRFVAMSHGAHNILECAYGVPKDRLAYIPHGAPCIMREPDSMALSKRRLGFETRTVFATFGTLQLGLGIEDVLHAVSGLTARRPDILYVIIGRTHMRQVDSAPSAYRRSLDTLVDRLGLGDNVLFIDRYLDLPSLIDYLTATSIYVHPDHARPDAIACGALAYAMAAGLLVVATPTTIATEILANRRGYLYPFRDVDALARRLESALVDVDESDRVREHAYAYGRGMTWEDVGLKYVELFEEVLRGHSRPRESLRPAAPESPASEVSAR